MTHILADTHMHTSFSSDSDENMEKMVLQGISLGLKKLYFTDHMDLDFPKKYEYDFLFNVTDQQKEIKNLQQKYSNKIQLFSGIELGLQPHIHSQIKKLLSTNTFDYVIGSIHVVNEMDPYCKEYWEQFESEEKAILAYFETALSCLDDMDDFDSFGHLDYVVRYAPSGASGYCYKKYSDIIDSILKRLIDAGKALELNTSGYLKNGFANPHMDVVNRFFELGGEMLTIGSDAHEASRMAADFDIAYRELKKYGLQFYTTFENRKPIIHSL